MNNTGKKIQIEIKNLSYGYNSRKALEEINLVLREGEFLGVIGPNGAGKTSLIRIISRVLTPDTGDVFFEGINIREMDVAEIAKRMAVVPQTLMPSPVTVEEFVLLGRIAHYKKFQFFETRTDIEAAYKALELTGTLKIKHRSLCEISGGERQLVLIARALAQEPKLLLLDEPTTYLDITHQTKILNLLKRLNRNKGITILAVLHDLNLASEYCERLILLKDGKIYKTGCPREILNSDIIAEVYKTKVHIGTNPVSAKHHLFIVSE